MAPDLPLDLTGRVALVTGGASGIGAGVCRLLAGAGARVVVGDIDLAGAPGWPTEIGGLALRCDVSVLADNEAAVAATVDGVRRPGRRGAQRRGGQWREPRPVRRGCLPAAMGVNLDGVVFGLAAALPALRAGVAAGSSSSPASPGSRRCRWTPCTPRTRRRWSTSCARSAPAWPLRGSGQRRLPGLHRHRDRGPRAGASSTPSDAADDGRRRGDRDGDGARVESGGEAWLVQYGHPAQPYRFRGVPVRRWATPHLTAAPRSGRSPLPLRPRRVSRRSARRSRGRATVRWAGRRASCRDPGRARGAPRAPPGPPAHIDATSDSC